MTMLALVSMSSSRRESYPQLSPVVLEAPVQVNHAGPNWAMFVHATLCADYVCEAVDVLAGSGKSRGSRGCGSEEGEETEALQREMHYGEM